VVETARAINDASLYSALAPLAEMIEQTNRWAAFPSGSNGGPDLLTPFLLPEIEKAIQPRIIHFAGPDKPWHRTWIGDQTYRRDILNVFRRYGVSPPQHRKRKPSLSDKIKKHMASIEPTRSIYTMHDKLKRRRAAQDFLDSVRLAEQNGEFADAQIITTA